MLSCFCHCVFSVLISELIELQCFDFRVSEFQSCSVLISELIELQCSDFKVSELIGSQCFHFRVE